MNKFEGKNNRKTVLNLTIAIIDDHNQKELHMNCRHYLLIIPITFCESHRH